jgi:hypothetical protein
MERFRACFAELDDPRTGNAQRHALDEIIMIALLATLSAPRPASTWRCSGAARSRCCAGSCACRAASRATTPSRGSSGCSIRWLSREFAGVSLYMLGQYRDIVATDVDETRFLEPITLSILSLGERNS